MSELSEHVSLSILADTVGIARAGFGVALIISHSVAWVERTRSYSAAADVATDCGTDSPEHLSAKALFSQEPHPEQVMIGRAALKPTIVYEIGVNLIANATAYRVNVVVPGATISNPLTYTSDADATNDEIVAGLVAALNGITGENYLAAATGSAGSQVVTVTALAPGNWFAIEVLDVNLLKIKQTHVDPGIATDLAAISLEDSSWYALHTFCNSKAVVLAAASYIEAAKKLYVLDVNETDSINTVVSGSTDTLGSLFALSYNRTAGSYYPNPAAMFSAAWMGISLPYTPGSETWKFKTLSGMVAVKLTTTQRNNLKARKANCYTTIGGVNKTWEGTVAGGSYGFIDITRGLDWLEDDMTKGVFGTMSGPQRVPYTNAGIAVIRNEVKASLKRAVANGIIDEDFDIQVPKVKDISSADKAIRKLKNVKFTATLQGAIHTVELLGVVSV